jgi:hypothetical protein
MDNNSKHFKDFDNITLPDCITRIVTTNDLLAVASLDNTITLWYINTQKGNPI